MGIFSLPPITGCATVIEVDEDGVWHSAAEGHLYGSRHGQYPMQLWLHDPPVLLGVSVLNDGHQRWKHEHHHVRDVQLDHYHVRDVQLKHHHVRDVKLDHHHVWDVQLDHHHVRDVQLDHHYVMDV